MALGAVTGNFTRDGSRALAAGAGLPRYRRGINFHHMLNWPDAQEHDGHVDYVWPPFASPDYQTGDAEFKALAGLGFDFIRLTADPAILITADEARFAQLSQQIKGILGRILDAGFNAVLDLHPISLNPDYKPAKLVESIASPAFQSYLRLIERMADLLKDMPPTRFAFELMNEPSIEHEADLPRWQSMLEALHARARAKAPQLPLILTGAMWGNFQALLHVDPKPFATSNVLYTFHYYDPHTFTHQGVEGDEARFIAGLGWPARQANIETAQVAAASRIADDARLDQNGKAKALQETKKLLADDLKAGHDAVKVKADFDAVKQWASSHGIAAERVLLGEFGCVAASHNVVLGQDRLDWLKTIREAAEKAGFPWALWLYKGYGGMALAEAGNPPVLNHDMLRSLGLSAKGQG